MSLPGDEKQTGKLAKLMQIEGYASLEAMLQAATFDSVSAAICMNDGCDYTAEMEPDQTRGWWNALLQISTLLSIRERPPMGSFPASSGPRSW